MTEIFVDGIRSVAVANGVVRIEFAQLRRSADGESRMTPEPVLTLMIPATSMTSVLTQLAQTVKQVQAQTKQQEGQEEEAAEEKEKSLP